MLISSCAAPGPMGRWMYHSRAQLKLTAKTIGADVVGTLFTGLISQVPHPVLCDRTKDKVKTLAAKLV